jgi:predicted phosphodiesterase
LGLPASDESIYIPHRIGVADTTMALVLSDIHVPYHSISAITAAIEDGKRAGAKIVILNGDTVDCYSLSRFEKDPRRRDLLGEVDAVKQLLDVIRKAFPDAEIVWKDGNHDERLAIYLCARVPEIIKLGLVNWPAILGFADRKITYVSEKRPIMLGKLPIMHGHEFPNGISGPVNAARGLYLRAKASAMAGHWHQSSEHSEPNINGDLITCWSSGCLCELHPHYMPMNRWNHGYALVKVEPDGTFQVTNRRVKNGRIY